MSRIGKLPILVPSDVNVAYSIPELKIKGKFGELNLILPDLIQLQETDGTLIISPKIKNRNSQALQGLYRSLINNMVVGVSEQFTTTLNLVGVGYRGIVQKETLVLNLGYSHQVEVKIPKNIAINVVKNTTIVLKGCDKQALGLLAAQIRSWRTPEPYKGKGILFEGEIVKRKAGKSGKK
jgi:large subunit ribosomal protein L6|tara:strand:- start:511 stop:1050 length:540 start_codon:yes stop_codon:yes gene_type:complete